MYTIANGPGGHLRSSTLIDLRSHFSEPLIAALIATPGSEIDTDRPLGPEAVPEFVDTDED